MRARRSSRASGDPKDFDQCAEPLAGGVGDDSARHEDVTGEH
jgi:hypothetical protein